MTRHGEDPATEVLDEDVLALLAEAEAPLEVPPGRAPRLRARVMASISRELLCEQPGFETVRADEGEWIQAAPLGEIKILHTDRETGALTYLARLQPGFSLPGHLHTMGEECLVLEGEVTHGNLTLRAGDYHFAAAGVAHGEFHTATGALVLLRGAIPV